MLPGHAPGASGEAATVERDSPCAPPKRRGPHDVPAQGVDPRGRRPRTRPDGRGVGADVFLDPHHVGHRLTSAIRQPM